MPVSVQSCGSSRFAAAFYPAELLRAAQGEIADEMLLKLASSSHSKHIST
jgi:hypothetical protein